jgi:small neutral amino acid transporter SnatA (MarC family)
MSDILRAALGLFAVLASAGGMRVFLATIPRAEAQEMAGLSFRAAASNALPAGGVAFVLLVAAALVADPFLDAIQVSGPSFTFAAAAAMTPLAGRLLLDGDSMAVPEPGHRRAPAWLLPVAVPLLASPSAVIAAIAYSGKYGEGDAIAALAIATGMSAAILAASPWVFRSLGNFGIGVVGRLSGALVVAIAVSLAVSGVHNV